MLERLLTCSGNERGHKQGHTTGTTTLTTESTPKNDILETKYSPKIFSKHLHVNCKSFNWNR